MVLKSEKVFVTDAQMRSSLAVIRALGSQGVSVTAGDSTWFSTGFFSKYVDKRVRYPSPLNHEDLFIDYIIKYIKNNKIDVLMPVADFCLEPIINHYKELSTHCSIALVEPDQFQMAYQKANTIKIAQDIGIPTPITKIIKSSDLYSINNILLPYPFIIKPSIGSGSRGFFKIQNKEDWEKMIVYYKDSNKVLLAQEFIEGTEDFGIYTLFNNDHNPVALTIQKRIRSFPVKGGPSTLRETFISDSALLAKQYAFRLLRAMNWKGPAMVEFKMDKERRIPYLMEVNPRFWGSLQLSIQAGVNFPYLQYKMAKGEIVKPNLKFSIGEKCRWMLPGDLLWLINSDNKNGFFPICGPYDIISRDDPGPSIGFFLATLVQIFNKETISLIKRG